MYNQYYLMQLFVSYGPDLKDEVLKRRFFLESKYNFTCDCKACKENWVFKEVLNQLIHLFLIIDQRISLNFIFNL